MLFGRVVHQDVQTAKRFHDSSDRALAERFIADVAGDEHAPATLLLDQAFRFLRVVVLVQVDDAEVGAFLGERDRDRAPDAAVPARDERDLVAQLPAAALLRIVALRARSHEGFSTGLTTLR